MTNGKKQQPGGITQKSEYVKKETAKAAKEQRETERKVNPSLM